MEKRKELILSSNDIYILNVLNKYRVIDYGNACTLTSRRMDSLSRRFNQLCEEGYIRKWNYINNKKVFTITKKGIKVLGVNSYAWKFNPEQSLITDHELKVLSTALHFRDKLNVDVIEIDLHADLYRKLLSGTPDMAFYLEGKKVAVEVERTSKGIKRTTDKIINNLTKEYDLIYYVIRKKHYRVIGEIQNLAMLFGITILDYDSYEEIV